MKEASEWDQEIPSTDLGFRALRLHQYPQVVPVVHFSLVFSGCIFFMDLSVHCIEKRSSTSFMESRSTEATYCCVKT